MRRAREGKQVSLEELWPASPMHSDRRESQTAADPARPRRGGRGFLRRAVAQRRRPRFHARPGETGAFRRGLASNLYAMGAPDKVVQRILRHSKPHVTKEHYIKVFDRTMVEAVERMQAQIEELRRAKEDRQQLELRFDDVQRAAAASECSTGNGFPHRSTVRPAAGRKCEPHRPVEYHARLAQ